MGRHLPVKQWTQSKMQLSKKSAIWVKFGKKKKSLKRRKSNTEKEKLFILIFPELNILIFFYVKTVFACSNLAYFPKKSIEDLIT